MSRQDQSVGEGGEAYQAGHNLTVNKGLSSEQMTEIMVAMATQLGTYFSEAEKTAEQRINDLRSEILEEFSSPNSKSKSEAFLDPDYQFVVKEAQNSYARNGDEWLKKELVRLLSIRSNQQSGSRKAMILNEAISIAGNLTQEEYSALSISFIISNVKIGGGNIEAILTGLNNFISPFINYLPKDNHAYDYLESMRCISINLVTSSDIWHVITTNYRMDLNNGFQVGKLEKVISEDGGIRNLSSVITSIDNSRIRFVADSREILISKLTLMGFSNNSVTKMLELHDESAMNENEIKQIVKKYAPYIQNIEEVWSTTKIQQSVHTALGKALSHSALVSRANFNAPLEIWVR